MEDMRVNRKETPEVQLNIIGHANIFVGKFPTITVTKINEEDEITVINTPSQVSVLGEGDVDIFIPSPEILIRIVNENTIINNGFEMNNIRRLGGDVK